MIELPGKTKADLFAAARSWFVDTFKDSKNVIEVNDESRGEITAKGLFEFKAPALFAYNSINGTISYRVTILVKEGKVKIEISRFIHEGSALQNGIAINFGLITNDRNPHVVTGSS